MNVISKDGTSIACERSGSGPALVIVDGAMCSRAFGPSSKLASHLASRFTVWTYDRRGRHESGDTRPYAPAREVEDLAAIVAAAGGRAALLGLSSGAALSLEAAASGVPIARVVAYEPPYVDDSGTGGGAQHEGELKRLLSGGDRAGALKYFMRDMVNVPTLIVGMMPMMRWVWPKLIAVAHTLPYDAAIMTSFRIPRERFATIRVPTLVMNGGKTQPRLRDAAGAIARVIPGAEYRELPGQTHNVKPGVLAPVVTDFLTGSGVETPGTDVLQNAQVQDLTPGRR